MISRAQILKHFLSDMILGKNKELVEIKMFYIKL